MEDDSEPLSNIELTILEIISLNRDIHHLSIMAQVKQMNAVTGQSFNKSIFNKSLRRLEKDGYIKRIESNPDVFSITSKGQDLL